MTRALRTLLVIAVLASGAALASPGCSSNEPAGTGPGPMGGAPESGKMRGGAMESGKMQGGEMKGGSMEPGKMDGGAMAPTPK